VSYRLAFSWLASVKYIQNLSTLAEEEILFACKFFSILGQGHKTVGKRGG